MAFDFKKEYKDLYLPKTKPELIDVPPMSFIAVAGTGNPNEENGSYAGAMGLLYAFSYTIKMSKMGAWQPTATSTTRCLRLKACGGQATKRSTGSAFWTRTRSLGSRSSASPTSSRQKC